MLRQVEQRVSTHDVALETLQKADRDTSRGDDRPVACSLSNVAVTSCLGFGVLPRGDRTVPRRARLLCWASGV